MKNRGVSLAVVALATCSVAVAETGEWTDTTVTDVSKDVLWTDATKWKDGYVPGGEGKEGDTASFPTDTLEKSARPTSGGKMMRRVRLPYGVGTFTNATITSTVYNKLLSYNDNSTKKESSYAFTDLSDFLGYIELGFPFSLKLLGSTTINHLSFVNQPVLNVENAADTVTLADSYDRGKLYKKGPGKVKFANWGGEHQRLQLEGEGEVEFAGASSDMDDTQPAATPWIWLDGSNTNRMELVDNGDGTFSVSKWQDTRETANTHYAQRSGADFAIPKLHPRAEDGRWVVDFMENSFGIDAGWNSEEASNRCARLDFERDPGSKFYNIYFVFKSNNDEYEPPLLGDMNNKHTMQNASAVTGKWAQYWTTTDGSFGLKLGDNRMDGDRIWFDSAYYRPGWHLLSATSSSKLRGQGLCFNRATGWGGAQIAEAILYDRVLTADEHRQTIRYLKHKWFRGQADDRGEDWDFGVAHLNDDTTVRVPADRTVKIKTVSTSDARTLTLVGGGTLETELLNTPPKGRSVRTYGVNDKPGGSDPMPVQVDAGTLRIRKTTPVGTGKTVAELYAAVPQDMSGHYDPSEPSSLTETDGKVTLWKNLANPAGGAWYPGTGASAAPKLVKGGINGLDSINCRAITNSKTAVDNYPFFIFNDTSLYTTNIYQTETEVFVVMCQERAGDGWGSFYPVGNTSSRWMTPPVSGGLAGGHYNPTGPVEFNQCMPQALYALDGVPLYQGNYLMITNAVVFTAANAVGMNLNTFARSQTSWIGGFEYGEIIMYSRRLSPAERRAVEAYLLKKWKNLDHPYDRARQAGATSVATTGALAVDAGAKLDVSGDLTVAAGGTLEFGVAAADSVPQVNVSGTLSIGDGSTIRIASDMTQAPENGRWTLARAATLSADVSKLTVEVPTALANGRLKVVNGELRYQMKQGMMLIFR